MSPTPPVDTDLLRQVEQFLFREARLADDGDYDGWEALWTDDGVYWVPATTDPADSCRIAHQPRRVSNFRQIPTSFRHALRDGPPSGDRALRLVDNLFRIGDVPTHFLAQQAGKFVTFGHKLCL